MRLIVLLSNKGGRFFSGTLSYLGMPAYAPCHRRVLARNPRLLLPRQLNLLQLEGGARDGPIAQHVQAICLLETRGLVLVLPPLSRGWVGICTVLEHRLCEHPTCEYRLAVGCSPTMVGNHLTSTQGEPTTVGGEAKAGSELVRITGMNDQDSSPIGESAGLCHFKIHRGAMQGFVIGR